MKSIYDLDPEFWEQFNLGFPVVTEFRTCNNLLLKHLLESIDSESCKKIVDFYTNTAVITTSCNSSDEDYLRLIELTANNFINQYGYKIKKISFNFDLLNEVKKSNFIKRIHFTINHGGIPDNLPAIIPGIVLSKYDVIAAIQSYLCYEIEFYDFCFEPTKGEMYHLLTMEQFAIHYE
jgi:hypothetical protein